MNKAQLITAIKKDNEVAFKKLFELYYRRLLAYVFTLTNNHVQTEDIVQQAFVSLWEHRHSLKPEKSIKNYLFTISRNIYANQYRKQKRLEKYVEDVKFQALQECIEVDEEALEKRIEKLQSLIESLPRKCREILLLNKIEGLKYKEIAVRLDISIKTVEAQMRIAFQKIREGFKDDELLLFITGIKIIN